MYLLIEVAGYINTLPTIGLVMLTAVIGVALLKQQGLSTLTRGMHRANSGELPATEIAEGLLLAVAGALLITPGFITDFVGFTLLFPPSRILIAAQMLKRVQVQAFGGGVGGATGFGGGVHMGPGAPSGADAPGTGTGSSEGPLNDHFETPRGRDSVTLEGDFERKD